MTTLTAAPVAPLLDRLFAAAAAEASPRTSPAFATLSAEEGDRLLRSKQDYRALYAALADFALPVSPATGRLLYMLARATGARTVVEFGTSFGLSTIHLAAALRDNGGGQLITTEFEQSKLEQARANLAEAQLVDLVAFREGDALATLAADLPATIDLVLLDGAKALYGDVLDLLEPRLRTGAVIVADNVDHCPDYQARVRSGGGYLSLPFGDDVELSVRLG